jgi:hypothetical protein
MIAWENKRRNDGVIAKNSNHKLALPKETTASRCVFHPMQEDGALIFKPCLVYTKNFHCTIEQPLHYRTESSIYHI